jgi:hypothetical protein
MDNNVEKDLEVEVLLKKGRVNSICFGLNVLFISGLLIQQGSPVLAAINMLAAGFIFMDVGRFNKALKG